jgi:hypothetical protein
VDVVDPPAFGWTSIGPALAVGDRQLRLLLSPSIGSGALDGAWWPYGQDLRAEAVDLADHFPASLGRIVRLLYCAADWTSGPGRVRSANAFVTLASFPHDDAKRVLLRTDPSRRVIQLLVVPPDWDYRAARHAMRIAASPTNGKSAATILIESNDQLRPGLAHWDDDGGHSASR